MRCAVSDVLVIITGSMLDWILGHICSIEGHALLGISIPVLSLMNSLRERRRRRRGGGKKRKMKKYDSMNAPHRRGKVHVTPALSYEVESIVFNHQNGTGHCCQRRDHVETNHSTKPVTTAPSHLRRLHLSRINNTLVSERRSPVNYGPSVQHAE